MLIFLIRVAYQREQTINEKYISLVKHCLRAVFDMEDSTTPQDYFVKHFGNSFKLADTQPKEEVESDDEMEDEDEGQGA
jgi:hypothetical protein